MRRWILNFHLYGGLLCSSYLIIFGLSSLHFNHQFQFARPRGEQLRWQRQLRLPLREDRTAYAEHVRDALGLIGWPMPWTFRGEPRGEFQFKLARPGKEYTIDVLATTGTVVVEEQRQGYWPVINALHGLGKVPGSRLATVWGVFTEVCTIYVLVAALSGIYLWTTRKSERWVGAAVLVLAVSASVGLMLLIRTGVPPL